VEAVDEDGMGGAPGRRGWAVVGLSTVVGLV